MDEFTKDEIFTIRHNLEDEINHIISVRRKSIIKAFNKNKFIILLLTFITVLSVVNIILINQFFNLFSTL